MIKTLISWVLFWTRKMRWAEEEGGKRNATEEHDPTYYIITVYK